MKDENLLIFMVIMKEEVYVKIAETTQKASIVTVANQNITGHMARN